MNNLLPKTLSPQKIEIYHLLLKNSPMSAKNIGQALHIIPNTIYRNVRELQKFGLVEIIDTYPVSFRAKPVSVAMPLFLSLIKQNFYENFGMDNEKSDNLEITFFQTRKHFIKMAIQDMNKAKLNINVIISGHEIPAELVLTYKKAVERGVRIRKLIQHLNKENLAIAKNYQIMGVETRYTPLMHSRIVIIDGSVAYFGSYSPDRQAESAGVRFNFKPFAQLMDQLFEQKWQKGKII